MGQLWGVPGEFWLALWTVLVSGATWFTRSLFRALRWSKEWEWDEILNLRKALDRLRRRENAYATGFEILLITLPPELTPEQRRAVQRSRELFETALIPSDHDGGA